MSKLLERFKKVMRREEGFTLVELLVVVGIIGLLAAALVPNVFNAGDKARDAVLKTAAAQIQTALELYKVDNGLYPVQDSLGDVPDAIKSYFDGGQLPDNPWDSSKDVNEGIGTDGKLGSIEYLSEDGSTYTLTAHGKAGDFDFSR